MANITLEEFVVQILVAIIIGGIIAYKLFRAMER
jgi:hypothetical protein